FVAHPLVHRALAEEAGDDRLGAARLEREGVAHRLRDGGRYDGGGSHHMGAHVHQMHRTGLAARATIGLTVEFGYHALEIAALGEIERVAAIGAERDIVRCKRRAHADRDRFLPNREMDRALDLVRRIILDDLFFDSADSIEAAVKSRKRFACRTHPYRSGSGDAAPVGHRSGAMTLENSSRFRAVTNISRPEVQRRTGRGIVLVYGAPSSRADLRHQSSVRPMPSSSPVRGVQPNSRAALRQSSDRLVLMVGLLKSWRISRRLPEAATIFLTNSPTLIATPLPAL